MHVGILYVMCDFLVYTAVLFKNNVRRMPKEEILLLKILKIDATYG
jgi:hypothetical protein